MTSNNAAQLWLELTLRLPVEYADEGSCILLEIGANAIEELCSKDSEISLRTFLSETERSLIGIKYLNSWLSTRGIPNVTLAHVPDFDWVSEVRKNIKPIRFGKLLISPTWTTPEIKDGDILIRLDPGQAFGTGHHETTSLCLELIVSTLSDGKANSFLDVGTGAGLLAIAAKKLGAHQVAGIDIDHAAVKVAKENAALNNVNVDFITTGPESIKGAFDIVAANILSTTILSLSQDLARLTSENGTLILSGILENEIRQIQDHFKKFSFNQKSILNKDLWSAIMLERF